MRGLVVIDGRFDLTPRIADWLFNNAPTGELRKNGYTLPSIVMGLRSNHFRFIK